MNIEFKKITIRDLTKGYVDNDEQGVIGFDDKLDIRPQYQRNFIYKDKQRDAVIETINHNFPLNVMYWAVRKDGKFEVIDGQQRTISICQFVKGDFSINEKYFDNLKQDEQDKLLDYELMVYRCSGTDSEKLKWFETINIAGEKLTPQELRNAVYSGSWVSDAKLRFSKSNCPASEISSDYVKGSANRQELLETAIKWISKDDINDYMAQNQNLQNANLLWQYYESVITWVKTTFPNKRKSMKGVEWGYLYNQYNDKQFDIDEIEAEIKKLILDDDVTKESGIYPYILTRDEKYLSIRAFTDNMKQKVYEKQDGNCVKCKEHFEISEMEADHIKPWHEGGKTIEENCQLLCKNDNRRKSGK
jgi:hypothetical protein